MTPTEQRVRPHVVAGAAQLAWIVRPGGIVITDLEAADTVLGEYPLVLSIVCSLLGG